MKLFDKVRGWHEKVNFVDHNNVFVGFDMSIGDTVIQSGVL